MKFTLKQICLLICLSVSTLNAYPQPEFKKLEQNFTGSAWKNGLIVASVALIRDLIRESINKKKYEDTINDRTDITPDEKQQLLKLIDLNKKKVMRKRFAENLFLHALIIWFFRTKVGEGIRKFFFNKITPNILHKPLYYYESNKNILDSVIALLPREKTPTEEAVESMIKQQKEAARRSA